MSEEGLKIKIGADATGVPETFQKVATSVQQTTESLGKVQKSGADAGNALMNLSRIAQDAPYGFMGVANNINPMLESFQRLQKETGSAGAALKVMVSGLTGPAGLGLAVGAISSLLVVFGDDLFSSSKEASALSQELTRLSNEADNAAEHIEAMMNSLQFGNRFGSLFGKSNGLSELQTLQNELDRTVEATKRVQAERDKFRNGPLAEAQTAVVGLNGKDLKDAQDNLNELNKKLDEFNKKEVDLLTEQATIKVRIRLQEQANEADAQHKQEAANKKAEAEAKRHADEMRKIAEKAAERAIKLRNDIQGPVSGGGTDPIKDFLKEQNKFANLTELQGNGPRITPNIPLDTLKNIKKTYGDLAQTLSGTLTPAFEAMFAAIDNGQNAFKALGQAIVRSIEQLIAQLAAMAAVAGILSLITGGAAGGGLSFMSAFNAFSGIKLPGHATGGITTGAHVAMVGEAGPEAIIPLDRLPSLIGQMGGGNVTLMPSIHYEGTGFRIMLNRVDKSINRRF